MRRKLLTAVMSAYGTFLGVSYLIVLFLVPKALDYYLPQLVGDDIYHAYLHNQSVAMQNICYLLIAIIFLLSLLPIAVFHLRVYRPLSRVSEAAAQYMEGSYIPITYNANDELGRLAATLNYLADAMDNSWEFQRKFVSSVSHDLRTPLTSIKGYVEAIQDGTIPPEQQSRYLQIVLNETERLNQLADQLLELDSFDDHKIHLTMVDFDLIQVIHDIIDSFEGLCENKHLQIQTSFPFSSVIVNADKGSIQQVIYNLLENAVKFSYPYREIFITVTMRKNLVYVSIRDCGEGIAKADLPMIWNRFYKTDASRSKDKKGTGLGLSIVKEIIRAHSQNIDVISTEGIGTEFVFTLDKAGIRRWK